VASARSEGDLSENAEYHGARESQGMMQAKINLLRDKLARAVIVERAKEAGDDEAAAEHGQLLAQVAAVDQVAGHDALGAHLAENILRRLRYPNDTIAAVVPMVARHMQFMNVQKMRVAKLKRFMAEATFDMEMELHRVDCGSSNGFTDNYEFLNAKAIEFASEPLIPPPFVTGRDLISLGLSPGPRFKQILEAIETEQLEGRITDRPQALDFLRKIAAE
jgi:hypothetical protein